MYDNQLAPTFQFQTGSIKSNLFEIVDSDQDAGFNSKLVRLKGKLLIRVRKLTRKFQFQTGSIKSIASSEPKLCDRSGFNSKLVRLKVACGRSLRFLRLFQFQTGSIKSSLRLLSKAAMTAAFQFQTGSIKRELATRAIDNDWTGFNSKLVRLKALAYG